ncbi:hypothetical protein C0J52_28085 [Blattella germanica]|nr:hypothetical protein C0J52_28085 [Blattella germanica]
MKAVNYRLFFHNISVCFRPHVIAVQKSLPGVAVSEDRRRGIAVPEREESGLRHHIPDALHPPAFHAPFRSPSAGLQRSSLHL